MAITVNGAITINGLLKEEQTKSVTPKREKQVVTPDEGYTLSQVTVSGDNDLKKENIKAGVNIFGVTGEYSGTGAKPEQEKEITPTSETQYLYPDTGKVMNKVTVQGDSDLKPENVKKGVDIFGTTGQYEGETLKDWFSLPEGHPDYGRLVGENVVTNALYFLYEDILSIRQSTDDNDGLFTCRMHFTKKIGSMQSIFPSDRVKLYLNDKFVTASSGETFTSGNAILTQNAFKDNWFFTIAVAGYGSSAKLVVEIDGYKPIPILFQVYNPFPNGKQSKEATPKATEQIIKPNEGYGFDKVVVKGDSDLVPENIKKDVEIFGVTGTLEGGNSNLKVGTFSLSDTDENTVDIKHNLGGVPSKITIIPTDTVYGGLTPFNGLSLKPPYEEGEIQALLLFYSEDMVMFSKQYLYERLEYATQFMYVIEKE